MKKHLLSLFLFLPALGFSQAITTSGSEYTPEELVNQVLLGGGPVQATNITSSTGTDFGSVNGLGSFTNGGGSFPMETGIILSTGNIALAPGPNANTQSSGGDGWVGDSDVLAIMQTLSPSSTSSHDATKIEFDFTATTEYFSLDYIFASEEYGTFQCNYSDAFIIKLTDTNTGISVNLGTVPSTTTPVTVVTVRSSNYNGGCNSVNAQYFGAYYPQGNAIVPINFNGRTVPLTAESSLVPGHTYHLKIAIADRNDHTFDSALFLGSINFNLPVPIGTPNDLQVCDMNNDGVAAFNLHTNDELLLNGLDPDEYEVSYFETQLDADSNTNAIANADSYSNIFAVGVGNSQTIYARLSSLLIDNYATASFEIITRPAPVAGTPEPISVLDDNADGMMSVDLTIAEPQILTGVFSAGFQITYYVTMQDAVADNNPIENPANYITSTGIIYFRMQNSSTLCFDTGEIQINILPGSFVPPAPTGDVTQYFASGYQVASIAIEGENIKWYDSPTGGEPLSATDTWLENGATYYATQTIAGVESADRLAVTIIFLPDPPTGAGEQHFLTNAGATVADLVAAGENIQWYSTYYGETLLPATTPLENYMSYYATQTINNLESAERLEVLVVLSTAVPEAAAQQTLAMGSTLADIQIEGENIQWYTTNDEFEYLSMDTVLEDGVTYYATQTVMNIESYLRTPVTVTLVPAPAPTGDADQYFFEEATIGDLTAEGQNIQWYDIPVGGSPLAFSVSLINGQTYYASQTVNNIEGTNRLAVTAHITSPPPAGNSEQTFSEGATLADIEIDGENIQWYSTPGLDIPGPPNTMDTPLPMSTVLADGITYYASQTVNGLESVQRTAVSVHLTLSAMENAFEGFTCFPNPVKDVLHISNSSQISNITVYNLVGQVVQNITVNAYGINLNFENLSKGIYLIKVQSARGEKIIKIVRD